MADLKHIDQEKLEKQKLERRERQARQDEKEQKEYTEYLEQNRINTRDIINQINQLKKIERVKLKFMENEFFDVTGYKEYLEKLLKPDNIYTDQVILTHIYNDYSSMFFKLGHGYGELLPILY
jgi:hypothetical protein